MPAVGIKICLVQGEIVRCNVADGQGERQTCSLEVENMLSCAKALQRPLPSGRLLCAAASNQPLGSGATPFIAADQSSNLSRQALLSAHDTGVQQPETP